MNMDVFNSNAFSLTSLTNAMEVAPYTPKMLGALKIFSPKSIRTLIAWIEKKHNRLSVIGTANRGTVGDVRATIPRDAIPCKVPHNPYYQSIIADDIQGARAFGKESDLETMVDYVNEQLIGMKKDHEATFEYHRVGALKGIVYDNDGTTEIVNLFTKFGLSQTVLNWYTNDTSFAPHVTQIIRTIGTKLGDDSMTSIIALCGNTYFDKIVGHTSMLAAYDRWRDGEFKRMSYLGPQWYAAAANGFGFQNVLFVNYRGSLGTLTYIPDNDAYYFPLGVDDFLEEIAAPADFTETVNTPGKKIYARQEPIRFNKGIELHTQSNVLMMNKRPDLVIRSVWNAGSNPSSSSA